MYLETILILSQERERVRAIDVSEKLGFSKPSVSRALKLLREDGLINVEDSGNILLLPEGRKIAETIYERHRLLTKLLISWGVDPRIAQEDACRIEHVISDETVEAIKRSAVKG